MDIDGLVERKGNFLVFETKAPNKEIPGGQMITLNALLKTGSFTVFFLQGKNSATLQALTICWKGKTMTTGRKFSPITAEYVNARTRSWFRWANGGTLPNDDESDIEYDAEIIRRIERATAS